MHRFATEMFIGNPQVCRDILHLCNNRLHLALETSSQRPTAGKESVVISARMLKIIRLIISKKIDCKLNKETNQFII